MSANTHFTVALHILTWMALVGERSDDWATSEQIARSVNTNAVFIRRILGLLLRAGLVAVRRGPDAGWRLARPADAISLRDVHAAVVSEPLFRLHAAPPNPACPVGAGIQPLLRRQYARAQAALEAELANATVGDLSADVRRGQREGVLPSAPLAAASARTTSVAETADATSAEEIAATTSVAEIEEAGGVVASG